MVRLSPEECAKEAEKHRQNFLDGGGKLKSTMTLPEAINILFSFKFVNKKEWAEALGVREVYFDFWGEGEILPEPDKLSALLFLIMADSRFPKYFIENFNLMMDYPWSEVVDRKFIIKNRTLRNYILDPRRKAFLYLLETLEPKDQEELLIEFGEKIRATKRV